MILVLSDLHLGYEKCNRDQLLDFLDGYHHQIDHLVLLGDIFEFWRRNNAEVVQESEDAMEKINNLIKLNNLNAENVHYVAGNHDYYILDLNKRYEFNPRNKGYEATPGIVSKYLRLEDGGESFFFIHGYELEAILWEFPASLRMYEEFSQEMCYNQDLVGGILSKIWDIKSILGKKRRFRKDMDKEPHQRKTIVEVDESGNTKLQKFALSRGKYPLLGMKPHENLIFGHTHWPFLDKAKKVANTGSWIDEIPRKRQNSYLEITEGEMELKFF